MVLVQAATCGLVQALKGKDGGICGLLLGGLDKRVHKVLCGRRLTNISLLYHHNKPQQIFSRMTLVDVASNCGLLQISGFILVVHHCELLPQLKPLLHNIGLFIFSNY